MRIVELVPSLDVGGAERMAALLARELVHLGHDVTVVSLYDPVGSWIEAELAGVVPTTHLGKRPGLDPRLAARLRRLLLDLRPEVVHTHLHALKYALPWFATPSRARPSRLVHTVHNVADHEVEASSRFLHTLAYRAGVVPVAIGAAVSDSFDRVYGFSPRHVIPNGIDLGAWTVDAGVRAAARAELGIGDEAVFLTVGRLTRQKNHVGLLAAFTGVAGARLLVAGDGELRAELQAKAPKNVQFLGIRRDVPRLLAAADAFVLASDWEGNPLVVMEAMAAGCPVIATAVGCVPELVVAGTGVLVPPGDPGALRLAMATCVNDRPGAAAMGGRARAEAHARFGADHMARRYVEAFR